MNTDAWMCEQRVTVEVELVLTSLFSVCLFVPGGSQFRGRGVKGMLL